MPKIAEAIAAIERFAPLSLQEEYDNSGLQYGSPSAELTGITVTLDLNPAVAEESVKNGDNLIISHHPTFFHPLKCLDPTKPELKAMEICIKNGIAVYAAHTNVDKCKGGLNDYVLNMLGATVLCEAEPGSLPRFGVFPEPVTLGELSETVAEKLSDNGVRFVGDRHKVIGKIALITGGGGDSDSVNAAIAGGADLFLSGDFKYHVIRFAKDAGYAIISFGHYESEIPFMPLIADVLKKEGFENVHQAVSLETPYNTEGRI